MQEVWLLHGELFLPLLNPFSEGKKVTSLLEEGKTRHNRTEEVQRRFDSQPLTLTFAALPG